MSRMVDIPKELQDSLRSFKLKRQRGTNAIVCKVNKQKLIVEEVEQFTNISIDELVEELPENAPRFVVLSYEHKYQDGRVNYLLILIDWVPAGAETGSLTLHAGAFSEFQHVADVSKVIQVRDGPEGLTKEIIDAKFG